MYIYIYYFQYRQYIRIVIQCHMKMFIIGLWFRPILSLLARRYWKKGQTSNWIKTKPTKMRPKSKRTYTTENSCFRIWIHVAACWKSIDCTWGGEFSENTLMKTSFNGSWKIFMKPNTATFFMLFDKLNYLFLISRL